MDKQDLAMYLVNLHTLLQAQTASVHNPSNTLANEYNLHWEILKETIDNETRARAEQSNGVNKDRTNLKGDKSGSSLAVGDNAGSRNRR